MLILIIFVLLILGFALYGFIKFVLWFFTPEQKKVEPVASSNGVRDLETDVVSACYLLDHLLTVKQLAPSEYQRIRNYLVGKFGNKYELPSGLVADSAEISFLPPKQTPISQTPTSKKTRPLTQPKIKTPVTEPAKPRVTGNTNSIVKPELIAVATAIPTTSSPTEKRTVAPWDIPDDPAPATPRRTLSDALGAFMQEKNIRWGELASGILIVGSAVGLVVSLRNELNQTIPYFTAILFMLITAAIHLAGSYTLKKWKLQKTSRGTLLIGLLLVPLNFLAACVLSNNATRSITDPFYLTAVVGGLGIFGFLTARSSKLLLRTGNLPVVVGIMATAAMTLVVNRLPIGESIWGPLLLSVPIGAALLFGSGVWQQRLRQKNNWTERSSNRLYMLLGLSLFAAITTCSLLLVRATDKPIAIVSLTPLITFGSLLASWVGSIVSSAEARKDEPAGHVASRALSVLGSIIAVLAVSYSICNPVMLLTNGIVAGAMFWVIAVERNKPWLLFGAWFGLATALVTGLNIVAGEIALGQWMSPMRFFESLISGRTGLGLMGLAILGGGAACLQNASSSEQTKQAVRRSNLQSAAVIAIVGAAVALAAGLLNWQSVFDTMTATVLLTIAAIGSLIVASRKSPAFAPHVASVILIVASAFTFLWNPTIADVWLGIALPLPTALLATLLVHAVGLTLAACFASSNNLDLRHNVNALSYHALTSLVVSVAISFAIAAAETGTATLAMLIGVGAVLALTWAGRKSESAIAWPTLFVFSTALVAGIGLLEFSSIVGLWSRVASQHWLCQILVSTSLAFGWLVASQWLSKQSRWQWLFGKQMIAGGQMLLCVAGIAMVSIVGFGLGEGVGQQLVAGFESQIVNAPGFIGLGSAAIALVFAAGLFNHAVHPSKFGGIGLVVLWCIGWAMPAFCFDDANASATALRWLLGVGAIVTSVLVGSRKFFSHKLSKSPLMIGQSMINWSLGIPVVGVLAITTATISRVMLTTEQTASLGGPIAGTWFASVPMELSYGVPAILITSALLVFAISEQRRWLAMMGSAVYQYVVLLAVALLFLSPHPQLATAWFLNILQAVSLGMSIYGLVWFVFRKRIRGYVDQRQSAWNQLSIHAHINAFLITSLAVLIGIQFYANPLQPGGWVNAAGGPMGLVGLLLAGILLYLVSRDTSQEKTTEGKSPGQALSKLSLLTWAGLALSAMTAACLDGYMATPLIGLRTIAFGCVAVLASVCWATSRDHHTVGKEFLALPFLLISVVGGAFLVRGGLVDPGNVQAYIAGLAITIGLVSFAGFHRKIFSLQYVGAGLISAVVYVLAVANPVWTSNWNSLDFVSLLVAALCVLSSIWIFVYIAVKQQKTPAKAFSILPNLLLWFSSLWLFVGGVCELTGFLDDFGIDITYLSRGPGLIATVAVIFHAIVSFWHSHVRLRVITRYLMSAGILIWFSGWIASLFNGDEETILLAASFGFAAVVLAWGLVWAGRDKLNSVFTRSNVSNLDSLEKRMSIELPIYALLLTAGVLIFSTLGLQSIAGRPLRYFAAMTPFVSAIGIGCLSNRFGRRWLQIVSLVVVTYATLLLSWADLDVTFNSNQHYLRTLLVFAGAMFVYGVLIPRWSREGDGWLKSLREMSMFTCALAFGSLILLITGEYRMVVPEVGCRLSVAEAVAASVVISGMIVGLLSIAMRPKLDPFSLSMTGRKAYVYISQAVIVLLVAHLYLSMPWLFRFGVREFWPYVAMLISFAGVSIASVLQRRKLEVLADPFFKTAISIPVVTSIAIFVVDAPGADSALVLLLAGMGYLLVSYSQRSILSGAIAVVLGNLALWVFYDRLQGFSFVQHPQLWLIPPAVSVLVAAHFTRNRLSAVQLATIRYVSVAVIYISSTSEVLISGIGSQLWPPMVLAALAVVGMFAGIALQIRAYLYLGSTFLLTAMIAMVSHAHQRLDHVWPWWAFGIALGILILVMFGFFEKRRNHLRGIAGQLQKWEL